MKAIYNSFSDNLKDDLIKYKLTKQLFFILAT